jgi:hypothetical protein
MKGHSTLTSSSRQNWRTPLAVTDYLRGFHPGMALDVASDYLIPGFTEYWGPGSKTREDALSMEPWPFNTKVFCNPPYKQVQEFLQRARMAATLDATQTFFLVPARTDTNWWFDMLPNCWNITFLKGRLKFWHPDEQVVASAPFPSAILHLGPATYSPPTVRFLGLG